MAKTRARVEFSDAQISKMSYEEARESLQEVVGLLETGGADLEESLVFFELSEKLADRCEEILDAVADRIEDDEEYEDDDEDEDDDE